MKFKIFRTVVLAAGLAAATQAMALPVNLVTNGSFESGFTGWTTGGSVTDGYPASVISYGSSASYPGGAFGEPVPANNAPTNSPDSVGTHAAYFVSDRAAGESLSQTIWLDPGVYQIGFSSYLPRNGMNNAGDATFSGVIAGVTLANFAASAGPATTWQTFSGETTITSGANYLVEFIFNTAFVPSKDVVIDQVYVIPAPAEVPEPVTLALLGLGLVGIAVGRRRKR